MSFRGKNRQRGRKRRSGKRKQRGGGAAAAALAASMFLPMIANTLSKNKKLGF